MLAPRLVSIREGIGGALMVLFAAQASVAARVPKPPRDAPFCLAPGTRPVFVAPMGEVFRGTTGGPDPATAWVAQADTDRDGKVGRAELRADAVHFFHALDSNGDGRLTPDEVARYEQQVAPEISLYAARREPEARARHGGLFSAGGSADGAAPVGAGRFAWLNIPEPVAAADADLDRVVTLAEFTDAADRRFDTLAKGGSAIDLRAMPATPQRAALLGPCRPPPKRRVDPWDDNMDAQNGAGG